MIILGDTSGDPLQFDIQDDECNEVELEESSIKYVLTL